MADVEVRRSESVLAVVAFAILIACTAADAADTLTSTGQSIDDFYPFGRAVTATLIDSLTNIPSSRWESRPVSPRRLDLLWSNPQEPISSKFSWEEFELKTRCDEGRSFLWLNAYRPATTNHRYSIDTSRAELRIEDGPWRDITPGGECGTQGQPYALADIVRETYSLRVWGAIHTVDGNVGRRYFWQHTIRYLEADANACWSHDGAAAPPALQQREAWWDSVLGWMAHGSGSMGPDGEPDGRQVIYVRAQEIAKGIGPGWRIVGAADYCMLDQAPLK